MTREQRAADKILRQAGWRFVRMAKGSHRLYVHPPTGAHTTVSIRCDARVIEKTVRQVEEHA